ncbi:MAG: acetylglutamate kinase [Alistipes sp.]|nr:acetylglutamate kinase [Alistipes sp.]
MIKVVKIGGNVIDSEEALSSFVSDFASIEGPKVLVHGGGKLATRLAERLDIPTTMIDGRRVTDSDTLDVVTMVYAGLVNKRIVAMLQSLGCNAIGLSGADGGAVRATRRAANPIDFGFVGDISVEGVDAAFIRNLTEQGTVPVFCSIMHDGKGQLLNCNADSVASAVAVGLATECDTELLFCFEKRGVMRDVDDDTSVIANINREGYKTLLAEGVVNKGMIPKIDGAFRALECGVKVVTIKHSAELADSSAGTKIEL